MDCAALAGTSNSGDRITMDPSHDRSKANQQKKKTATYLFLMKLSTFEGSPKELGGKHCMLFSVRRNTMVLICLDECHEISKKTRLEL